MGEIKDAQSEAGVLVKTHIGGQALIEGIMMRGRYNWAVAVREPSGGIYTEEHDLASGKKKNSWMYWPVVRGCTAMVESLVLAYKALEISANHSFEFSEEELEEERRIQAEKEAKKAAKQAKRDARRGLIPTDPKTPAETAAAVPADATPIAEAAVVPAEAPAEATASENAEQLDKAETAEEEAVLPAALLGASMIVGTLLGVVMFIVLPAFITNLIVGDIGRDSLTWNIVDGLLRIVVFVGYIWLISLMKDIKRMFRYHGAEHKTIHCFEHGLELTPENAMSFPRLHVRCGTAFLIMTMIIAIFVYTIFPTGPLVDAMGVSGGALRLLLVILIRILLMPLIAGLAYEVTVKWAGGHPENPFVKIILWPGMQMQRLTTKQPDEGMIECAIAAMNLVLEREKREAELGSEPPLASLSPCELAEAAKAAKAEAEAEA